MRSVNVPLGWLESIESLHVCGVRTCSRPRNHSCDSRRSFRFIAPRLTIAGMVVFATFKLHLGPVTAGLCLAEADQGHGDARWHVRDMQPTLVSRPYDAVAMARKRKWSKGKGKGKAHGGLEDVFFVERTLILTCFSTFFVVFHGISSQST